MTSPLVPWNSCGAYMAALGVADLVPAFRVLQPGPVISLIYGFTGFRIEHIEPAGGPPADDRRPCRRPRREDPRDRCRHPRPSPTRDAGIRAAVGVHDPVHPHRHRRDRDLDHPGRPVPGGRGRRADPGTYARVDPNPQRIIIDSLMAPINGMYGIEGEDGRSASGTPASSGHRRRAVHPRHRRVPRGDDEDRGHRSRHQRIVGRLRGRENLMIPSS